MSLNPLLKVVNKVSQYMLMVQNKFTGSTMFHIKEDVLYLYVF